MGRKHDQHFQDAFKVGVPLIEPQNNHGSGHLHYTRKGKLCLWTEEPHFAVFWSFPSFALNIWGQQLLVFYRWAVLPFPGPW